MQKLRDTTTREEPARLWNKTFIMILIVSTCNSSATMMINPLISKYCLSIGISLSVAATITSLMSIVALVMRPFSGLCSDRFNRKNICVLSCVGTGLSLLLYSFSGGLASLTGTRLLHGIVFSFSSVAMTAFHTTFIPQKRLGEGMGWLSLGQIISFSLGPNLGLWLAAHFSYAVCFRTAAVIYFISTLIILSIPYTHTPVSAEQRRHIDINSMISLRVLPYACLVGLFSCGNGLETTFIALLGDERGIANIGLFFTAYSIVLLLVRPFSGKLLDKKGLRVILYPALILYAAGVVCIGSAYTLLPILIAGILKAVGQGAGQPAVQSHCIKALGREKAGVVSSTCFIGSDIGNSLAPIIGSFVAGSYGYGTMFYVYALVLLAVGLPVFYLKDRYDVRKYGDPLLYSDSSAGKQS